ncbi:hypothetical protein FQA39_LY11492 [Lamprigera yunnana]|nr:hypothetical protein FQA39_LY11492 [Lamprigera yunnana]
MECLSCVICKEKDAGKINPFTESTLNKCRIALKIRQEYKLKYCDVILPSEVSSNKEGYHRQCYANLTSIKKQYKQNLSAISLESPSTSDIPPRSDQVVEIEEIVQTVPELEDSALFLDNPPRGEQIIEEIEIVQTEPQLQLSVSHTDNENQPDNQDDDEKTSYNEDIFSSDDSAEEDSEDSSDEDEH